MKVQFKHLFQSVNAHALRQPQLQDASIIPPGLDSKIVFAWNSSHGRRFLQWRWSESANKMRSKGMSFQGYKTLYCSDCDSIYSSFFRVWTDEEKKQYIHAPWCHFPTVTGSARDCTGLYGAASTRWDMRNLRPQHAKAGKMFCVSTLAMFFIASIPRKARSMFTC